METIKLLSQEWTNHNLNVTHFQNGDSITLASNAEEFKSLTEGKKPCFAYFKFDKDNFDKYGCCYNWFAINDKRGICPPGFRIPNNDDFNELLDNFCGKDRIKRDPNSRQLLEQFAIDMKAEYSWGPKYRLESELGINYNGTNKYGFNAIAHGTINNSEKGGFTHDGIVFSIWSITKDSKYRWSFRINEQNRIELSGTPYKDGDFGRFVRLIKGKPKESDKLIVTDSNTGQQIEVAQNDIYKIEQDWHKVCKACNKLGDGWRLPTLAELELMYNELHKNGIGKFKRAEYWSSTELDENYASVFDFYNGTEDTYKNKHRSCYGRTVRTI